MDRSLFWWIALSFLLVKSSVAPLAAQERTSYEKSQPQYSGPIAKDGGVEITHLEEARTRSAYAVPQAAKTANLRVALKVYVKAKGNLDGATFLYRFLNLEPVLDDTGKSLAKQAHFNVSSPAWSNSWPAITEEVAVTGLGEKDGKHGHTLNLNIDAPARQARTIKAIKGKLEVIEPDFKYIEIRNLVAQSGKPVADPDLKDIQITPYVKKEGMYTTVSLQVTGKVNRLWRWRLMKEKSEWRSKTPGMQAFSGIPGGREGTEGFQEGLPEGVWLLLEVLIPGPRHTIPFELKDIELP